MNYSTTQSIKQYFVSILFSLISVFSVNSAYGQCPFNINLTQTNNLCNQTNNGSVTVSVTSSTNIEISWKNAFGFTSLLSDSAMSSLPSGIYIVLAEDTITACKEYKTVVIKSYFESYMNTKNVSCPSCEDGIAELFFTGGIDTFVYQWDDNYTQTTRKASDLEIGTYVQTLTDSANCQLNTVASISDCGQNLKADFVINTASCSTCNDASILANISGGVSPYNYQWDDALNQTTALASNLDRHLNYNLVITDSLGCQKSFFIDSREFCQASIQPFVSSFTEASCDTCTDGILMFSTNGDHPNFNYFWYGISATGTTLSNETPSFYTVQITDTIGCSIDFEVDYRYCYGTLVLNEDSLTILNEYVSTNSVKLNDNMDTSMHVAYSIAQKAEHGLVNMQIDGSFTYTPFYNFSGFDYFTYKVFSDCGFSKDINVVLEMSNNDMVWPGDVDLNGIVDNFDLLPLAVFYDSLGAIRNGASENYFGQIANNWSANQINNVNIKHADCNGSGLIEQGDINVIEKNYGVVHSKSSSTPTGNIPLKLLFPDSTNVGDTVEMKVILGEISLLAQDVYGLAYTFNFDKEKFNTSYVDIKFNDSWFTPNNNRLSISKQFLEKGRVDIAQSRKNGLNASGEGEICSIIIVIEEDVDEESIEHIVNLDQIKLIQNDETPLFVNSKTDIVSSIHNPFVANDFEFDLKPNPSNGKVNIQLKEKGNYDIEITNALGQIVFEEQFNNMSNITIDMSLTKGIYFIKLKNNHLESMRKLVIIK